MTKRERQIKELAEKWAKAKNPQPYVLGPDGVKTMWYTPDYWEWKYRSLCGRKLLKILEAK